MYTIQHALPADAAPLSELARTTFFDAFGTYNSDSDMAIYASQNFGYEKKLQEIGDAKNRVRIAWAGGRAIGFYYLVKGNLDPSVKGPRPIGLSKLYVDKHWHGKKIGEALLLDSLDLAQREGFETMGLAVWEQNLRARAFYRKNFFAEVGKCEFILGTDRQTDLILQRPIQLSQAKSARTAQTELSLGYR
jgi:GNAT superfamily N-acetyltransferase